jgi:hypothetical protein
MDLIRDVRYRGFYLNRTTGVTITGGGGIGSGIIGSVLDSADMSDTDVVQFLEKRSQQDGMDAGDVFLGARRIRLAGTLYNVTRATLFDDYWSLRAALSPVLAQRESPLDRGYRPLLFSVPTNRLADYPAGAIDLQVLALPRSFQALFSRNQTGGEDDDALAIPWQATLISKDPSIMAQVPQTYNFTTGAAHTDAGNTVNRGNYICPIDAIWVVTSASGTIAATVGDSVFTVTVPASTGARTIRFKGVDKVLTVEENGVEVPRYDLLTFTGTATWPLVATGTIAYSFVFGGALVLSAGSLFRFSERYA